MWLEHLYCEKVISDVYSRSFTGCPMSIMSQNLKALKQELRTWNKVSSCDVHANVKSALAEIDRIQNLLNVSGISDDLIVEEQNAQLSLKSVFGGKRLK